jgi:hypothetical protein
MKRLLLLSMCVLLTSATMVKAETVYVTATRASYNATWDAVSLNIVSMEGTVPASSQTILAMLGTWTANGGVFSLPGGSSVWYTTVTNNLDKQDRAPVQTWLNFSTSTTDTPSRLKPDGTTGAATTSRSFTVGQYGTPADNQGVPNYGLSAIDPTPGSDPAPIWNPDDEAFIDRPGYNFDNTLLGTFYVSKSTTWAAGETVFTGKFGYGATGAVVSTVQIVPEPSTIALLGCGLFGLLAYAWRKRK